MSLRQSAGRKRKSSEDNRAAIRPPRRSPRLAELVNATTCANTHDAKDAKVAWDNRIINTKGEDEALCDAVDEGIGGFPKELCRLITGYTPRALEAQIALDELMPGCGFVSISEVPNIPGVPHDRLLHIHVFTGRSAFSNDGEPSAEVRAIRFALRYGAARCPTASFAVVVEQAKTPVVYGPVTYSHENTESVIMQINRLKTGGSPEMNVDELSKALLQTYQQTRPDLVHLILYDTEFLSFSVSNLARQFPRDLVTTLRFTKKRVVEDTHSDSENMIDETPVRTVCRVNSQLDTHDRVIGDIMSRTLEKSLRPIITDVRITPRRNTIACVTLFDDMLPFRAGSFVYAQLPHTLSKTSTTSTLTAEPLTDCVHPNLASDSSGDCKTGSTYAELFSESLSTEERLDWHWLRRCDIARKPIPPAERLSAVERVYRELSELLPVANSGGVSSMGIDSAMVLAQAELLGVGIEIPSMHRYSLALHKLRSETLSPEQRNDALTDAGNRCHEMEATVARVREQIEQEERETEAFINQSAIGASHPIAEVEVTYTDWRFPTRQRLWLSFPIPCASNTHQQHQQHQQQHRHRGVESLTNQARLALALVSGVSKSEHRKTMMSHAATIRSTAEIHPLMRTALADALEQRAKRVWMSKQELARSLHDPPPTLLPNSAAASSSSSSSSSSSFR